MIALPFHVPRPLLIVGVYVAVVYVHELGHYVTGRWLVGIPASELRIVMTAFPQHVALRDEAEWVRPRDTRYDELYRQYDPEFDRVSAYVGAGTIGQTVGAVGIAALLIAGGMPDLAEDVVAVSILLTAFYLVYEGGNALAGDLTRGDFSALWGRSPVATVAVLVAFAVPHGILYLQF